ncbi:mycothiol synthase [Quadrisphaera setariae]|uniref:mycothiol synthase n=1 Tax=Quadrisphaera setariae TaxID=2593304 RepID=UPI001C9D0CA2|nr:mycothiol synthase [Quadrisphaera setariae]
MPDAARAAGALPPGALPIRALPSLSAGEAAAVEALVERAAAVDGGHPLSEASLLALREPAPAAQHALLVSAGPADGPAGSGAGPDAPLVVVGYAQLPLEGAAELLVDPAARRRGLGSLLAEQLELLADGSGPSEPSELVVWAHGGSAAAAALARRRGYGPVRELQHRRRPLGPDAPLPPLELPDDVALRAFEVGRDEQAWLDLNARAFASHPEQGRWTAADLAARQAEPWFDPAGLLLAVDAQRGRLLASHWTKVEGSAGHRAGEVYVVAVDPAAQGRGLGTAVVLAGLHHLDTAGCASAELYVEADNAAALRLYERLGFELDTSDVLYRRGAAAPGVG